MIIVLSWCVRLSPSVLTSVPVHSCPVLSSAACRRNCRLSSWCEVILWGNGHYSCLVTVVVNISSWRGPSSSRLPSFLCCQWTPGGAMCRHRNQMRWKTIREKLKATPPSPPVLVNVPPYPESTYSHWERSR